MNGDSLLLKKLLVRDFRDNWPFWKKKIYHSLGKWRRRFLAELGRLMVLALCVWGGYVVFLYYLQSIWVVFAETPMGEMFATQVSPEIVLAITAVLDLELAKVAYACVTNVLLVTVTVGVLLKFSGLYRLTYLNRGFLGTLFWGSVCTALSADLFPIIKSAVHLNGNAAIYFLPTMGLLAGSFGLSAWLVPEFTVIFRFSEFISARMQIIKIRDLPYHRQEI